MCINNRCPKLAQQKRDGNSSRPFVNWNLFDFRPSKGAFSPAIAQNFSITFSAPLPGSSDPSFPSRNGNEARKFHDASNETSNLDPAHATAPLLVLKRMWKKVRHTRLSRLAQEQTQHRPGSKHLPSGGGVRATTTIRPTTKNGSCIAKGHAANGRRICWNRYHRCRWRMIMIHRRASARVPVVLVSSFFMRRGRMSTAGFFRFLRIGWKRIKFP